VKIIFLDVDGVLNNCEYDKVAKSFRIHPEKIQRLNRLLKDVDAHIVLSSSWRYFVHNGSMNLHGLEWLFRTHGLEVGRLVDITPPDKEGETRGQTIDRWIKNHRGDRYIHLESYVVIDDMCQEEFKEHAGLFIRTNPALGLTDINCELIKRILA